jgi:hypothetical protein
VQFGCTLKNEGKRVHVPPDEKTCGHAVIKLLSSKAIALIRPDFRDTEIVKY